jgi:hypothetical protein
MNGRSLGQSVRIRLHAWSDRLRVLGSSIEFTPAQITVVYGVLGFAALYFSDV